MTHNHARDPVPIFFYESVPVYMTLLPQSLLSVSVTSPITLAHTLEMLTALVMMSLYIYLTPLDKIMRLSSTRTCNSSLLYILSSQKQEDCLHMLGLFYYSSTKVSLMSTNTGTSTAVDSEGSPAGANYFL